jgi:hypothetical protein
MQVETNIRIKGYLVGNIWMPDIECYKRLSYNLTRENERLSEPGTLRDHVLRATRDGDFQSCSIADGVLLVTRTKQNKTGTVSRTRAFPLRMFPSIADCLNEDWAGPTED